MSLVPPSSQKTIMVSGGFDPIHVGHIRMIQEAAKYGSVMIVLNSDEWLIRKKGFMFMKWEERAEICASIKGVISVHRVNDEDNTVCDTIKKLKPTYFANGGDRKPYNTPEQELCNDLGVEMIWKVGGDYKANSSSDLTLRLLKVHPQSLLRYVGSK